jgi:hypothetical protein
LSLAVFIDSFTGFDELIELFDEKLEIGVDVGFELTDGLCRVDV